MQATGSFNSIYNSTYAVMGMLELPDSCQVKLSNGLCSLVVIISLLLFALVFAHHDVVTPTDIGTLFACITWHK